ncbi:hypothetical protein DL770_009248 [Monosporascus sp. CRB-9-2]|nr:hypothetical protein DL770_009248 [Monosporascus sp. CRB-9-2]
MRELKLALTQESEKGDGGLHTFHFVPDVDNDDFFGGHGDADKAIRNIYEYQQMVNMLKDEYDGTYPEDRETYRFSPEKVIKLMNPLYGLKQTGAAWQERVREILAKLGFHLLISDNAICDGSRHHHQDQTVRLATVTWD